MTQYIQAFTVSSDRVRRLLLISVVASILVFAAFWSSRPEAWWVDRTMPIRIAVRNEAWRPDMRQRLSRCPQEGPRKVGFVDSCKTVEETLGWVENLNHGEASLKALLSELEAKRVQSILMVDVPFLGIHFDINDLGAFAAIGLSIIAFTLALSVARQYENLYLCLWKIRRIAEREGLPDQGESKANFLYHSLAMAQVFTRPPTLARWQPGLIAPLSVMLLLSVPALAHVLIWINDLTTIQYAIGMNRPVTLASISVESLLFLVILTCGFVSCCYTWAAHRRWEKTFFTINPGLQMMDQPCWWEWVKITRPSRWSLLADDGSLYFGHLPLPGSPARTTRKQHTWKMNVPYGQPLQPVRIIPDEDVLTSLWSRTDSAGNVYSLKAGKEWQWELSLRNSPEKTQKLTGEGWAVPPVLIPGSSEALAVVENGCVLRLTSDGRSERIYPHLQGQRRSSHPRVLGLTQNAGALFVADFDEGCVFRLTDSGEKVTPPLHRSGHWWRPVGLAFLGSAFYVLEERPISAIGTLLALVGPQARLLRLAGENHSELLLTWWRRSTPIGTMDPPSPHAGRGDPSATGA